MRVLRGIAAGLISTALAVALTPAQAQKATAPALKQFDIDPQKLQSHQMTRPALKGIVTSRGLKEGKTSFVPSKPLVVPKGIDKAILLPHLDVGAFGKAVDVALKDQTAGYAMQLRQGGNPILSQTHGNAKSQIDGGKTWAIDVEMHVASLSKLITAMAMTKLLDDKKLSYDTKIIHYLPTYWAKGKNVEKITFRHLLTHRSGFATQGSASDYLFMKSMVAAGVAGVGSYDYENMNFGICRILIPIMNGDISRSQVVPPTVPTDAAWDYATLEAYKTYVTINIFNPAGVTNATLDHKDPYALAYTFPVTAPGWNSGDVSSWAGGAAWHVSVQGMLDIMGTFRRKNTIMPKNKAGQMLDNGFGVDLILSTPAGRLYNKNGLWQFATSNSGPYWVEQGLAYLLPQDMELVIFANSWIGEDNKFFRDVITQIYVDNLKY